MRTRKTLVLALLAIVSLFTIACGGDDKTATPAPPETPSPTATSAPSETATATTTATETATPTETATETATPVTGPAELDLGDGTATSDGVTLVIPSATLAVDGFVAIHADDNGAPGLVIGVSDLLAAGTATDIEITLDQPLAESGTVFPMVHVDGDANGVYEFPGPDGPATTADGEVAVAALAVTVEGAEPTETSTAEPTETGTEEPTETPTGEPTTVETREPDPDAEAFAHAALLDVEALGEGWTVDSEDQFDDSLTEEIESTSAACQEINEKIREANAISTPARIGRAARAYEGPQDPNNFLGGDEVDLEINVFDDEDVPSRVMELYNEALSGDLYQTCFEESFLAEAPEGTDATIEQLTPSTEAPHDGAELAFSLSFGAIGITFNIVFEAYVWAQDDLGVTLTFSGSEANPELVTATVDAVHEKIDDTPR